MAGGIRTPSGVSAIYGDGSDTQKEDISYCEHCLVVGIKSKLHKRLWVFNTETKEIEQVAEPDRDKYMQCYNCGDIFPIYEIKKEAKISDFVETTDDPFDNNPGNMETFGKTPSQSVGLKIWKNKRRIHKDPEIQHFLDRGDDVSNINESL
jgi:hypothetical protein